MDVKDVTSDVVQHLNDNVPKTSVTGGGIAPNRLPEVATLKKVDSSGTKQVPLLDPTTGKWLADLSPNPVGPYATVASTPVSPIEESLVLKNNATAPAMETLILEVQSDFKPKLVAVSYPKELEKDKRAQYQDVMRYGPVIANAANPQSVNFDKLTFVVFFRPRLQQRVETTFGGVFGLRPGFYIGYQNLANEPATSLNNQQLAQEKFFYPYGWDYLFYEFWHYLNYEDNPAIDPFFGGLPNQVFASGKKVVLVIPILSFANDADAISDPAQLVSLLLAVQKFIFAEKFKLPVLSENIGSIILSAFSNGNYMATQVLQKAQGNFAFSEAYMFDAPKELGEQWIEAADRWAKGIYGAGVIRIYTQSLFSNLSKILNTSGLADAPTLGQTMDGTRSVALIGQRGWSALLGNFLLLLPATVRSVLLGIPPTMSDPKQIGEAYLKKLQAKYNIPSPYALFHPLFPAFMLNDALRRSKTA